VDPGRGSDSNRCKGVKIQPLLTADPIDRITVNMGTISRSPFLSHSHCENGQVHRRLTAPGWGGGSAVVRAWESRVHGEGTQRVRNRGTGMPGGRR